MKKQEKLDKYEQDLEDNLEFCKPTANESEMQAQILLAAKRYLSAKKPVTIRISTHDLEAIKIKASKLGVPYQTYINMLIHKDALSL